MLFVIEVDNDGFKVYDSAGNLIDPAKDTSVTALGTLLTAIKNTDGIKKIVDALPTGDNTIGRAKITDGTNVVDVFDDSGIKRLRVDAKINGGTGPATKVYLYDDVNNVALAVADGVSIPTNTRGLIFAGKEGTTSRFVLVDGQGRLIVAPPGTKATLKGFSNGRVVLAATAIAPVNATTYTEQTSNAQRSIASSSANDTAAGTGARTVKITYYSVSAGVITGPFYETVTLNGTSYVNTVSTTIAFIEKIEVLTVGSGLTNAGILTLKAATAGGGATIATVAAGDGQTFLGHHYVASGRIMYLTGVSTGIKGADAASFFVKVSNPSDTSVFDRVASDILRIGTNQSTVTRPYGTPIEISGPAHVQLYVQPDSTSSRTYFAAMDFYEE